MNGPAPRAGDPVLLEVNARRLVLTVFVVCVSAEILWFVLDYVVNYMRLTADDRITLEDKRVGQEKFTD